MLPIISIMGTTATGKTALGVRLARELGGEVINADALQVYRGLDIGTDKPTPELRRRVPHHLVDILDPHERYSAGEFVRRAEVVIEEIHGRGGLPIVVGGSGLYQRALLEGLSPMPPTDPEVRRELEARLETEGLEALRAELVELDPPTAERLAPADRQRTLRALEVLISTGRPLSAWVRRQPFGAQRRPAFRIGLTLPRAILYDSIAARVEEMVRLGWVEEVTTLIARGVDPSCPAFQAIGYRQIARHVTGEWSLEAATKDTVRATRRYAKRQTTWFRKEQGLHWISAMKLPDGFSGLLEELARWRGELAE
jgi:tRNA dimethylallyltransferase